MSNPIKLHARHIKEQWTEGDDGYWILLKPGYKCASDPDGPVHAIHEPTRAQAYREQVMRCDCKDCAPAIAKQAKKRHAWMGWRHSKMPRK